jgi:diguanylate cyclase (GGDEF)-like protein
VNQLTPAALVPATDEDLLRCAQEQIHIPGTIQPHGVLISLPLNEDSVTHASLNLETVTGMSATRAIGAPLDKVIGKRAATAVRQAAAAESNFSTVSVNLTLPCPDGFERHFHVTVVGQQMTIEIESAPALNDGSALLESAQSLMMKMRMTQSLSMLSRLAVEELQARTGYDRVMVYQFDRDGHGEVIAEALAAGMTPYLHLRYPASDIPPQARRLYLMTRLRMIGDVHYQPVPIATNQPADTEPLDLSLCALRSVSPVHLEYLANMGAAATLTISIIQDQHLWGMVVCHHRTPRLPSQGMRAFCEMVGQLFGLMVAEVQERDRLFTLVQADACRARISNRLDEGKDVLESLAASEAELLKLVGATGAVIRLCGALITVGQAPPPAVARAMLDAMPALNSDELFVFDDFTNRHPDFWEWKTIASGVLFMPLANNYGDGIMWFRPEVIQSVKWGGDPHSKAHLEPLTQRISPRRSFAAWAERVEGQCLPWHESDQRSAGALRRILTRALLRETEAALFRLSNTDPLTGLANRNVLDQRLAQWRAAQPFRPAALLFFDLDRFKTVNDSLGHYAGDDLLRATAQRLTGLVGGRPLLVRYGGDEFVIFYETASPQDALILAQQVLALFEEPFTVADRPYRTATSIGVAFGGDPEAELLREADAAMYAAKRQGGNRAVMFEPSLHERARDRLRIEQDLLLALERGELSVHYQPIVDLPGGELRGFEALARWQHPERGFISPGEFIPLAEETGQIIAIGHFVMCQALDRLASLPDPELRMCINVASQQLLTPGFSERLQVAMADRGLTPSRVVVEVTESTLMAEAGVRELERVRALGCSISIDDFGTGYSSLSYLRRLPVDIIKIDRSFVAPLGQEADSIGFLAALVQLAHTLRLRVVAEGVETAAQVELLAANGCDKAQGYFFGRPQAECDLGRLEVRPEALP